VAAPAIVAVGYLPRLALPIQGAITGGLHFSQSANGVGPPCADPLRQRAAGGRAARQTKTSNTAKQAEPTSSLRWLCQ